MSKRKLSNAEKTISLRQICERTGVTLVSVIHWMRGTQLRVPLPYTRTPKGKTGTRYNTIILESDFRLWLSAYRPDLLPRFDASA